MKKILALTLVCIMTLSCAFSVVATSDEATFLPNSSTNLTSSAQEVSEKKIICKATTEDEYESDSVIVVFKNSVSKNLGSFTTKSFSEISVKSVTELTSRTKKKIERQRIQAKNGFTLSTTASADELYVNENEFHQIVKIDLGIKSKENVLACIKKLETRSDVLAAFPNYYFKPTTTTPNDTYYQNDSQWAIDKIQLPSAWDSTTGNNSVKVGILDSGIDSTHNDLKYRYNSALSKDFTGGNSPGTDVYGHGTQVAGIIGAQGNNSIGVTGVCWNVSLVSLKVGAYNDEGNFTANFAVVADAVDYATDNNIPILNFSYCGENEHYNYFYTKLSHYNGLFVCSTTNDRVDISNDTFAHYTYNPERTIVVAGTNQNDVLFTFYNSQGQLKGSSYSATKVHLAAPGDDIWTTNTGGGYICTYGTSMATPFVAGVAALLKSKYPGMDAEALKDYILSNVDVIPALNGKVVTGGRLNAYKALTNLKNYTVQYNANGGGGVGYLPTTMIYGCATPLNRNNFGKSGHKFVGWHAQIADTGEWYYTNGSNADWYTEGSQPNNYYKYTFSDGEAISRTIEPGKTMVMYAQWEKRFNIQFMGNNATSGTVADMVISEGQNYTLPSGGFTRTGCTLQYWYAKDADGNYYFSNNGDKIWHSMSNIPSGYVRTQYAPGSVITANDVDGIDYDETIYMYAYWQPNSGLLGDVNGDGNINVKDSTKIQSYVSGLTTLTAAQLIRADVDFSGGVNINDATDIQKYSSGVLPYFG